MRFSLKIKTVRFYGNLSMQNVVETGVKCIYIVECPHTRGEHEHHPGPLPGDVVEIECVGGFVKRVDPKTQEVTSEVQRFSVEGQGDNAALIPRAAPTLEESQYAYEIKAPHVHPRWNPPVGRKRRRAS